MSYFKDLDAQINVDNDPERAKKQYLAGLAIFEHSAEAIQRVKWHFFQWCVKVHHWNGRASARQVLEISRNRAMLSAIQVGVSLAELHDLDNDAALAGSNLERLLTREGEFEDYIAHQNGWPT